MDKKFVNNFHYDKKYILLKVVSELSYFNQILSTKGDILYALLLKLDFHIY